MLLILAVFLVGILTGYLTGGRLSRLAGLRVRLPLLAVLGLAMQVAPLPGHLLPVILLDASFVVLLVFAVANLRRAGFALILLGIALNFAVILANTGMPVTRQALIVSHQQSTLSLLVHGSGAKHHLASPSDVLLPLADVIGVGPVRQIVSVGDIATYLGVIWLIAAGMRRRPAGGIAPLVASAQEALHAGG